MWNEEKLMKVLILGGTGAMGVPLMNILLEKGLYITCTTRQHISSSRNNVKYIQGNAKDIDFLKHLLKKEYYDCIVDFMSYTTKEFNDRVECLLDSCGQYIFISSARVYAQNDDLITEDSPRLLDISQDKKYLLTDEYALAKARQENMLFLSKKINWTIIRPTITYSDIRLQLGILEKENWLYRVLHGRSIVFSKDIMNKVTTMTTATDVAQGIAAIIGKKETFGEVFHITSEKSFLWQDILNIYVKTIVKKTGIVPNVVITDRCVKLKDERSYYQIVYSRYYNRRFDNTKIKKYVNVEMFEDPQIGLEKALTSFLEGNRHFSNIDWRTEAYNDKVACEHTPLSEINGSNKIWYLCWRYNLEMIPSLYQRLRDLINKMIK